MWLLILEALAALALLGGAVWWTMFSGRRQEADEAADTAEDAAPDQRSDQRPDRRPDRDKP